jgi:hypothetical protein
MVPFLLNLRDPSSQAPVSSCTCPFLALKPFPGYLPKKRLPQLGLPQSGMVFFFSKATSLETLQYLPEGAEHFSPL